MNRKTFNAALTAATIALVLGTGARDAQAGCGDFNGDGSVTASDALAVLQVAIGTNTCDLVRCDVDGGGGVGATDALIVLKSATGQQTSFDCPGVAISEIDQLPLATGPVAGASGLASLLFGLEVGGAETGINLSSMTADTFDAQSSIAACEVSNITRNAINSASEADRILCYVRNSFAGALDPATDIYDGEYHTFALDFGTASSGGDGEDDGPSRVRMRLVRDEGGTIVDFEMFMCGETPDGEAQDGYVRQAIDGPDFSMLSVNVRDDSSDEISVTGSLNDAGQFVGSKLVQTRHDHFWGDGSGYGALEFIQESDSFSLDGFDAGTFNQGGVVGTYTHQLRAAAELLDDNNGATAYDLSLLAVGHGAARLRSTGSDSWGDWNHEAMQGWNGDTTRPDSDAGAPFLSEVESAALAEVGAAPVIGFTVEQSYDCGGEIDGVVSIDMPALDAECAALQLGWEWVNCWEIIQPGDDGCDGGDCGDPCWDEACDCHPEDPACFEECWNPECDDPCADGQCEPPCEGPNCGDPCWNESCGCNPEDPACFEECWNPECDDPCADGQCEPPCEGPNCGDPCWNESCGCNPEDPACFEACWNPECDDPCADGQCEPPCEGPNCVDPCWDETCDCNPEDPACFEACWNPECDDPCAGGQCEPPCEGPECEDPCWDESCDCNPEDPACFEACWNPECDDPCADGQCEPPCEGPECEDPCADGQCEPPCEGPECEDPCADGQCEPPCEGPNCVPPCEGPECDDPCADGQCEPPCEGPNCEPPCEGPECDDPCADGQCEPPCEGPNCEPPCEGLECEGPL